MADGSIDTRTAHVSAEEALALHASGRPGKLETRITKPITTARDLSLAYSPGVAEPCLHIQRDASLAYDYTAKGNMVAVVSNGTAVLGLGNLGARGIEAGDGGQDRAVQALRRHRRHRSRDRHRGRRRRGQRRALPGRLRRHQPGGHQGAGMLRHRAAAARVDGHSGVPRRPARHRHRRRGRADQRLPSDRPRAARHQAGGERRRRGGHRLRRTAEGDGHAARARGAVRHQGRGLPGPHRGHEPVEVGACRGDQGAHADRGAGRRRRVLRPVGEGRGDQGHGAPHGRQADHLRDGQSRPGDHAGGGARGQPERDHRHRPQRLSQSGQQRSRLSLHLPRRARRARQHDQRGDEDRRGRGAGATGARGCAGRGALRLGRTAADVRRRTTSFRMRSIRG